jgi:hypothetical protein
MVLRKGRLIEREGMEIAVVLLRCERRWVGEGEGKETGESGGVKEKHEWNLDVVKCTIFHRRDSALLKRYIAQRVYTVCKVKQSHYRPGVAQRVPGI